MTSCWHRGETSSLFDGVFQLGFFCRSEELLKLLPMSMVQMGRNKLRDPRGLFLPLVGPGWFVRLMVGASVWGSFGWFFWFSRKSVRALVDLPKLKENIVSED